MKIRMFEFSNEIERVDLSSTFQWLDSIDCEYLAVKHDKDDTRPHYHVFVRMNGARDIEDIANQLKTESQYIERVKKWSNALAYAFHLTETSKHEKYRYDETAVVQSKRVDIQEIFNVNEEYEAKKLVEFDFENHTLLYYQKQYLNNPRKLRDLTTCYSVWLKIKSKERVNRKMKVIYITGASGSGKTTFAKFNCFEKYGLEETYISSSSNDPFSEYSGEKAVILDDLRGDSFKFHDLLKALDNNTGSSVKSRYYNKQLCRCECIYITSTQYLEDMYKDIKDTDEEKKQLFRRITEYWKLNDMGKSRIVLSEFKYDPKSYDKVPYMRVSKCDITKALDTFKQKYGDDSSNDNDPLKELLSKGFIDMDTVEANEFDIEDFI